MSMPPATSPSRSCLDVIGIENGIFMGQALEPTGFGGTIKHKPEDFIVSEIDMFGHLATVSTYALPSSTATAETPQPGPTPHPVADGSHQGKVAVTAPITLKTPQHGEQQRPHNIDDAGQLHDHSQRTSSTDPCDHTGALTHAATTAKSHDRPDGLREECSPSSLAEHLLATVGAELMGNLGKLDAAARGSVLSDVGGKVLGVVKVVVGGAGDKTARALVHRAVQESFPFLKTATEKGQDGVVTVVCSRAPPSPKLRELLSYEDLEGLQRLVNRGPNGEEADKGVMLSADNDRNSRTLVHRAIAEAFPYLHTKTTSDGRGNGQQRISAFWARRYPGKKRKRDGPGRAGDSGIRAPKSCEIRSSGGVVRSDSRNNRPVRFVLRKEGREHNRVAAALAKALHVPVSALSFAGIKDKAAITTQGLTPVEIMESNGSIAGVTVGNLAFCDKPLRLGELSGNRFSIVIRGADVSSSVVESCVADVAVGGFVNFFGTQRIGSPAAAERGEVLSHQIGKAILQGDWEGAVRKILHPRKSDPDYLRSALSDRQEGRINARDCATRVRGNNRLSIERLVLQGLVRYGDHAFQAAVKCVPYGARTMWVHAYQSYIWNVMASARIRVLGRRAVPGDLILPWTEERCPAAKKEPSQHRGGLPNSSEGVTSRHLSQHTQETATLKVVGIDGDYHAVKSAEARHSSEKGVQQLETPGVCLPRGCSGGQNGVKKPLTVLTAEHIEKLASDGITAEKLFRRVVLPLPGTAVRYPTHEIGIRYKEQLQEDSVDPDMWHVDINPGHLAEEDSATEPDHVSPAASSKLVPRGAYRRMICLPTNMSWAVADSLAQLRENTATVSQMSGSKGWNAAYPLGHRLPGRSTWTARNSPSKADNICSEAGQTAYADSGTRSVHVTGSPPRTTRLKAGRCERLQSSTVDDEPLSSSADAETRVDLATSEGLRVPHDKKGSVAATCAGRGTMPSIETTVSPLACVTCTGEGHGMGGATGVEDRQELSRQEVGSSISGEMGITGAPETQTVRGDRIVSDVLLSFTLPPGSFATMCLREVMKCNLDIVAPREDGGEEATDHNLIASEEPS